MQEADGNFVRGMKYLAAARRCQAFSGDEETQGKLGKLAVEYRRRGTALMMIAGETTGVDSPAPANRVGDWPSAAGLCG